MKRFLSLTTPLAFAFAFVIAFAATTASAREGAEQLAGLGNSLSPLIEGHLPARRRSKVDLAARRAEARTQAQVLATRLVDEARFATLDILGDGAAASAIAARRFRSGINAEA